MSVQIHVTGVGMISAIGNNVMESLQSIASKKSGIGPLRHIQTRHSADLSVGEVPASNKQLEKMAGITSKHIYTRTSLLGIIAAKEAMQNAGITDVDEFRTGIVSATSVGGMGMAENLYMEYLNTTKDCEYLEYVDTHECGDSTERIADELGIRDYLTTISTACSSSANAIMFGARLIKNGILDRVIVGGTDSLSRFTINGFLTLKILDPKPCKPFDEKRNGLNLGEGAGFIMLESENASKGKKTLCRLSGYGNSNDAYHQTASSPEGIGALLAMEKAFQVAGLKPRDIDYINAHGTGTELNDLSEGTAIEKIFGKNVPPISSTKAFTGHTLGAAGGIEAVLAVMAIQKNILYPSLNFFSPMPELKFSPNLETTSKSSVDHVLSNSFGFGGNTSSLIFSR